MCDLPEFTRSGFYWTLLEFPGILPEFTGIYGDLPEFPGVSRSLLELVGKAALLILNEQFPHEVVRIFPFLVDLWFCPASNWRPWLCGNGAVLTVFARFSHWKKTGGELLAGGAPRSGSRAFSAHFDLSVPRKYHERIPR